MAAKLNCIITDSTANMKRAFQANFPVDDNMNTQPLDDATTISRPVTTTIKIYNNYNYIQKIIASVLSSYNKAHIYCIDNFFFQSTTTFSELLQHSPELVALIQLTLLELGMKLRCPHKCSYG